MISGLGFKAEGLGLMIIRAPWPGSIFRLRLLSAGGAAEEATDPILLSM